jgi:hypothetical protein
MINTIINRPFPFLNTAKDKIWISLLISFFIYFFLLIFKPFGLNETELNIPVFLLGFLFITLGITLLSHFLFPFLFTSFFNPEKWNIGKLLIFMFVQILLISILNWFYTGLFDLSLIKHPNLISFLFFTLAIGFFPVVFFVLFIERYLFSINQQTVNSLLGTLETKNIADTDMIITLISENKNEDFSIKLQDFICVKSEGNYVDVYFYDNNKNIENQLIRTTLVKLEKSLVNYKNIKRCHRSYLVNLDVIDKVSGNARNYSFHINNLSFSIPVSRNFSKEIIAGLS